MKGGWCKPTFIVNGFLDEHNKFAKQGELPLTVVDGSVLSKNARFALFVYQMNHKKYMTCCRNG